jgi:hypothetical protein
MTMSKPILLNAVVAAFFAVSIPFSYAAGPGGGSNSALTSAETADLLFMREEEKLARDTYHTLYELYEAYGLTVFSNIESSEQSHMDAILKLLIKYGLPDPAAGKAIGEFTDHELQALYDLLIEKGVKSPLDALQVGGIIEETDMEDIKAAMERSTHLDIDSTYDNLLCGSRNHLRAFAANIVAMTGQAYTALVLPQWEVDQILANEMENCGTTTRTSSSSGRPR